MSSARTWSELNDAEVFRVFAASPDERDAAFAELYARCSQKLYMYALRMAGNSDDANDVFQETWSRFYRHPFHSGHVTNVLSYLLTSARNIFLNSRRVNARWSPFDEKDAVIPAPPYEREELFNIVGSALELLDVRYREAFILRFYEGLSYKEMADITGDSVSALKVRVMRAKDRIREILSPYIADLSKNDT